LGKAYTYLRMWIIWALLFLEEAWAVDTYAAVAAQQCTNAVGCAGYYRAIHVTTSPGNSSFAPPSNVTGVSVACIGAQASTNGNIVNGKLDVAGFRFKTPADTSDANNALSFYFGYLGLSGTWDNSTKTGSVVGALAEILSYFSSINVYYDNDGVPGFQWNITQTDPTKQWDILNCAAGQTNGYDAFDPAGSIDLKNLIWTPLVHSVVLCNSIPVLSTAPAGCEIHSLTTTGSNSTNASVPVITIVLRLASQPVLINNVLHGPDRVKYDVTIQFPWASFPNLYAVASAKLAFITFGAGKSGDFAAVTQRPSDAAGELFFAADATHSSYYAFARVAKVDGQAENVTTQVINGQQILGYQCPAQAPCSGIPGTTVVITALQRVITWLTSLGWKSSLAFHSLGTTYQPGTIFWDPEVGAGNTQSPATNGTSPTPAAPASNSAALLVPSLALAGLMFH